MTVLVQSVIGVQHSEHYNTTSATRVNGKSIGREQAALSTAACWSCCSTASTCDVCASIATSPTKSIEQTATQGMLALRVPHGEHIHPVLPQTFLEIYHKTG